jgi:hypothetical protein
MRLIRICQPGKPPGKPFMDALAPKRGLATVIRRRASDPMFAPWLL